MKGQGSPIVIKSDFERASINAVSFIFPDARISGCLFHFGQNIQRQLQIRGLIRAYKTDLNIKKYVKALLSHSFVRFDKVVDTFNELKNSFDFPSELS